MGSLSKTKGAGGILICPLLSKNLRYFSRISSELINVNLHYTFISGYNKTGLNSNKLKSLEASPPIRVFGDFCSFLEVPKQR